MRTPEAPYAIPPQFADPEAAALHASQGAPQEIAHPAAEPFWDPNAYPNPQYATPAAEAPAVEPFWDPNAAYAQPKTEATPATTTELPADVASQEGIPAAEARPKVSKAGKFMGKVLLKLGFNKKGATEEVSPFAPQPPTERVFTFMNPGPPLPESVLANNPFLLANQKPDIITSLPGSTPETPEPKAAPEIITSVPWATAEASVATPAPEVITNVPAFEVPRPKPVEASEAKAAARLMESQGFVRKAPTLDEQLHDTSRTNVFRWEASQRMLHKSEADPSKLFGMTEQEGMVQLASFLDTYIAYETVDDAPNPYLMNQARSIRENLTFIGEKEYAEAVAGLAEVWKGFLDADPKRQMCVTAEIAKAYQGDDQRKSDAYLFDRIMEHFSDEELEKYAGRLVKSPEELTADAGDVRVVILDDWSISGSQATRVFEKFNTEPWFAEYSKSIEINLLTSIKSRIENGLQSTYGGKTTNVPVRSYFVSHDAPDAMYGSHTSGTHSSVDYDFENTINSIMLKLQTEVAEDHGQQRADQVNMPPLTNIDRPYRRTKPAFIANEKGHIIRNRE